MKTFLCFTFAVCFVAVTSQPTLAQTKWIRGVEVQAGASNMLMPASAVGLGFGTQAALTSCGQISSCPHPVGEWGPAAMAPDGTLYSASGYFSADLIHRSDPVSCTAQLDVPVTWGLGGLEFVGNELWVVEEQEGMLHKLDPSNFSILSSFELPGYGDTDPDSSGIAWDGAFLWHADYKADVIYRLDANGVVISTFPNPIGLTTIGGLAYQGGLLIATDVVSDTLYSIDPATGLVVEECPAPGSHCWGLAVEANGTLVLSDISGSLFRVSNELNNGVGLSFCNPMDANCTGLSTLIRGDFGTGFGSGLYLSAFDGPPGEFGYFLVGDGVSQPGLVVGNGRFCLAVGGASTFGRYHVIGSTLNSIGRFDPVSGQFFNLVGNGNPVTGAGFLVPSILPLGGGPQILAGSTWNFQLWHRDSCGGAPNSNFSSGLSYTF